MESIQIPEVVPVMTLPNTVFFPQSLLPLHVFEPRYRAMLRQVLATDRLFAVARLDQSRLAEPGAQEPVHHIASLGLVRACQEGEDGTSNLLLQGVCRIEVTAIERELPYRRIRIRPLASSAAEPPAALELLRLEILRLLATRRRLGSAQPKGLGHFLRTIDDADTFADVAVFNLCEDGDLKQSLLEELDTGRRLRRFAAQLRADIESQRLRRKLQGELDDKDVTNN